MKAQEVKEILLKNRPERPRSTDGRKLQCAIDEAIKIIDVYEELVTQANVTISSPELFNGCLVCDAHSHCVDAFCAHSIYCNAYGKTCGY